MVHRYRFEYLKRKKKKELEKLQQNLQTMDNEAVVTDIETDADVQIIDTEMNVETSFLKELLGWILYVGIIIGVTFLIVTYVGQRTRVSGDSMEPSLHHGDNLIVDKISYRFREPERYEIIVFPYKYQENTFYIKRIIGLPGETVQIKDGAVYIDGELLGETYGIEEIDPEREGLAAEPIQLGKDEYFVLGDNRNRSSDSRDPSVGILKKEDLIGRAWVRIWPLQNIGVIPHE